MSTGEQGTVETSSHTRYFPSIPHACSYKALFADRFVIASFIKSVSRRRDLSVCLSATLRMRRTLFLCARPLHSANFGHATSKTPEYHVGARSALTRSSVLLSRRNMSSFSATRVSGMNQSGCIYNGNQIRMTVRLEWRTNVATPSGRRLR